MRKFTTRSRTSEAGSSRKDPGRPPTRRWAFGLVGAILGVALLAGCEGGAKWHTIDVSGSFPALDFAMTRVSDSRLVTAADYRGDVVMVYFGYTFCPDVCPTTLMNVDNVLKRLGTEAKHVRFLFVTVDPRRDTAPVLKAYVRNFARQVQGLRGTPDQLARLARRYRVVYSATPATKDHPYEVSHSSAVYVFDGTGAVRLLVSSLGTSKPDLAGTTADLRRLVEETHPVGWLARIERMI